VYALSTDRSTDTASGRVVDKRIKAVPPCVSDVKLFLRWWLIRVLLLLAENVEDLVYRIQLLLRVRLLALIRICVLLSQQVSQNTRGAAQWIFSTGHQVLQFHLSHLLDIGSEHRMLESPSDHRRYYDLALIIGQGGVHVSADAGSPNLLAEALRQHSRHVKIERLADQVRSAGNTNVRYIEQRLQIVGLRHSISHHDIACHFKNIGVALVFLQ
jgi:hypothetical protein